MNCDLVIDHCLPTGLVSKNKMGALKIAVNILLCKLRDAAKIIK